MMKLVDYLESKPLHYDKIDFSVVNEAWNILSKYIKLPFVIHIVGTNGKGTTGRFLASFLNQLKKSTLHYSSPHIIEFNERIWIDGQNCSYDELDKAHHKLQTLLPKNYLTILTYFEYTTLIALYLSDGLDYIILEAGLGGEFDATNVVNNDLTLFTTIGLDHQNFLGNTLKDITLTKARSCDNTIIVGNQNSEDIIEYIRELFENKREVVDYNGYNIDIANYKELLPNYLLSNLKLSLSALLFLKLEIKEFILPTLFGRYQQISSNITIDVGHNPLAAKVIYEQLNKENKKINLIYNSYKDKDFDSVIEILKDVIKKVYIIKCSDERIVEPLILKNVLIKHNVEYEDFKISNIDENDKYLVFGSFLVVEEFLKQYEK